MGLPHESKNAIILSHYFILIINVYLNIFFRVTNTNSKKRVSNTIFSIKVDAHDAVAHILQALQ